MQGIEGVPTEAYKRGMPQGEATEGNVADDILMVDQSESKIGVLVRNRMRNDKEPII